MKVKDKEVRFKKILNQINRFVDGHFDQYLATSGKLDEVDAIIAGLNVLGDELNAKENLIKDKENRLDKLLDVLLNYCTLDFSSRAAISEKRDEVDALAAGMNALADELNFYIQQLKLQEEKITQANGQMQLVLENLPIGIYALDGEGVPIFANKKSKEILGKGIMPSNGIDNLNEVYAVFRSGTDEMYPNEELPILQALLKRHQIYLDDLEVDNGERRVPLEVWSLPIEDGNGKLLYALAAFNEITERRQAQMEIELARKRKRLILENLPLGIFVLDEKGKPIFCNEKSFEILGRGIMGDPDKEIYSIYKAGTEVVWNNTELPLMQAYLNKTFSHIDNMEVDRQGDRLPVEVWGIPVLDEEKNLLYAIAAFNDITERRNSEAKLHALNKELESFSYSVSHDLRAPLRAINGYARMLMEDYESKIDLEGKRLIEIIRGNAKKMGQLVDDLLEFSRMGKREMNKISVNLDEIVNQAKHEVIANIETNAQFRIEKLGPAKVDPTLMEHVFINLIDNAVKYSSKVKNPLIEIGVRYENDLNVYYVRDNGAGFDMVYYDKLFGVFQRLHRNDEFDGTGVGLAIVHRIISRHGGKVWAEGKVNEGAVFYFTLNDKT